MSKQLGASPNQCLNIEPASQTEARTNALVSNDRILIVACKGSRWQTQYRDREHLEWWFGFSQLLSF